MENKEVPKGVKVISYLIFLAGIVFVVFGLFAVLFRGGIGENRYFLGFFVGSSWFSWIIFAIGIFQIVLGTFLFYIKKGLLNGKNWARVSVIILSIVYFAASLIRILWLLLALFIPLFNQSINQMRLTFFGKFLLFLESTLSVIGGYLDPIGVLLNFELLFILVPFSSIFSAIVYWLILKYLLFNKEAKEFFNKG